MTEVFEQSQLQQVKSTWNDITTNNRFHNDSFFSRLYSNLLIKDSYLSKSIFHDDEYQISQEALLFGDLFEFIIENLDDIPLCQEFLLQFQQANAQFVNHLTKYIEPMGNAILVTLKQWIGHENVSRDLETLWIKVYCFIADEILELTSDADSTFSQEQPLQLKQSTPESDIVPVAAEVVSKPPVATPEGSVLRFSLDKNEKYKGFRRSVQENYTPNNEPVTITIPGSYSQPKSTMSSALSSRLNSLNEFDPRSSRRSLMTQSECGSSNASIVTTTDTMITVTEEPALTPRSSRRSLNDVPSLVKKLSERQSRFIEDSDSEEEPNVAAFDPRKRKHSRSNSVDHSNGLSEEIPAQKQSPKPSFDSNSFGLQGLAPIDENEFDDTASSRYDSGDDNSFTGTNTNSEGTDIISSGASTLSLHDRSSSLSSGTEPMSSPSPDFKSQPHVRTASGSSTISYMKPLSQPRASIPSPLSNMNSKYSRSASSLLSEYTPSGKNRVSMGFMRSSFVLKKEMEELGFNMPENTAVEQLTPPAEITVGVSRIKMFTPEPIVVNKGSPSSVASKGSNDSCMNYINSFETGSESTLPQVGNSKFGNPQSKLELVNALPKQKRSFGSKLKSFFGKSKSSKSRSSSVSTQSGLTSNTTVAGSYEISSPSNFSRMESTQGSIPRIDEGRVSQHPYASRYESMDASYDAPRRTSESRTSRRSSRQASKQMYSSNYGMKNRSMSDVASIGSGNSSVTGFSFFGSTSNLQRTNSRTSRSTKGNKYQVKAVPYNIFARGV